MTITQWPHTEEAIALLNAAILAARIQARLDRDGEQEADLSEAQLDAVALLLRPTESLIDIMPQQRLTSPVVRVSTNA